MQSAANERGSLTQQVVAPLWQQHSLSLSLCSHRLASASPLLPILIHQAHLLGRQTLHASSLPHDESVSSGANGNSVLVINPPILIHQLRLFLHELGHLFLWIVKPVQ